MQGGTGVTPLDWSTCEMVSMWTASFYTHRQAGMVSDSQP